MLRCSIFMATVLPTMFLMAEDLIIWFLNSISLFIFSDVLRTQQMKFTNLKVSTRPSKRVEYHFLWKALNQPNSIKSGKIIMFLSDVLRLKDKPLIIFPKLGQIHEKCAGVKLVVYLLTFDTYCRFQLIAMIKFNKNL